VIQSKIAKFSHPCIIIDPDDGVTLEMGYRCSESKKNENDALVGRERSLTSFSAVWIQYTNVKCGSSAYK